MAASVISPSLAKLFNLCLNTETFPRIWKTAKVIPLYKDGEKADPDNYRPISILPILSKIIERHIHNFLTKELQAKNLIYHLQSGFRKSYSTETALIKVVDQLLMGLDKDKVSGLLFGDFRKAFDLVNHQLLLKKLQSYGLSEKAIKWFQSYLLDRHQYVAVNGVTSSMTSIKCGLPQGTVLGPLLFILFINDLPKSIINSSTDIFTDDTTLTKSSHYSDVSILRRNLQEDVSRLNIWYNKNSMVLSHTKTKTMLVTGKRLGKKLNKEDKSINIYLNDKQIEQVSSQKLLGIIIDDKVTFTKHIDKLSCKLAQRIALLKNIRPYLPLKERIAYYNATVKSV